MGVASPRTDVNRHQEGKECILFLDPLKSFSICKELTGLQRFINTVNSPTYNSDSKLSCRYRFAVDRMRLGTRKRQIEKWVRKAKCFKGQPSDTSLLDVGFTTVRLSCKL